MSRARAAAVCLALVLALEAASVGRLGLAWRLRLLRTFSSSTTLSAELRGSTFAFDRRYGAFLAELRQRTPPSAVIALRLPDRSVYPIASAGYFLLPRRVVSPERRGEADYAAEYSGASAPGTEPIPYGRLERLR